MGRDFLDAGNFSPKERAILTQAARILEARVRAGSVALSSPALVREWLALQFSGLEREVFGVIYLDAQHRLIGFEALFTGTLTQTSVYPREVVKAALARNAAAVMFVHNHPSGCAEPSQGDQVLTETLKRNCQA
jgi:DNA repair protein RadC